MKKENATHVEIKFSYKKIKRENVEISNNNFSLLSSIKICF